MRTCDDCGRAAGDGVRFCPGCGASLGGGSRLRRVAALRHLPALRRFWWVVAAGVVLGAFAGVSSLYKVHLSSPYLEQREVPTYSATARLLVTTGKAQHLRTRVTIFGELPEDAEPGAELPVIANEPLHLGIINRATNLYPFLIESDAVVEIRRERYGVQEADIRALGIYSYSTAGRIGLSDIPVIRIVATAAAEEDAMAAADATAKAFVDWVDVRQDQGEMPAADRIVVTQLTSPQTASSVPGTSRLMPLLVFLVVVGAFCALAVLLDRAVPSRRGPRRRVLPVEAEKPA